MSHIENAEAVRVVAVDGTDLTEQVTLTGAIPDLELTVTDPEVARRIARVELKSRRSELWCRINIGLSEQEHLARQFGPVYIDARVQYVS